MLLTTKDGYELISLDQVERIKALGKIALKARLSIIAYNKSKNENNLNACARHCNEFLKGSEGLF